MASELTGRPVRGDIAMTGEITLSGRVLPIGGVKEKVLAARRVGIREVILPKQNAKNVNEDLTPELRRDTTVHLVSTIEEVLALALQPVASDVRLGAEAAVADRSGKSQRLADARRSTVGSQKSEVCSTSLLLTSDFRPRMTILYSPRYHINLGLHAFPTEKYRLVYERLLTEGFDPSSRRRARTG